MTEYSRQTESPADNDRAAREHLRSIVEADEFAGSERRRHLLVYLVEETLAGRGDSLKAYNIGRKALGRRSGFDPQSDPIVRVEIGRLRATLDRYYRAHPSSPIVIGIPKGRYAAEFDRHEGRPTDVHGRLSGDVTFLLRPLNAEGDAARQFGELIVAAVARLLAESGALVTSHPDVWDPDEFTGAADSVFELSGSVRVIGGRVRCTMMLHRHSVGSALHTARVDEMLTDQHPFDVADRIAERIAWTLRDDFGVISRARRATDFPRTFDRYEDVRRASCAAFESPTPEAMAATSSLLEHLTGTIERDPRVLADLSDTTFTSWWLGFVQDDDAVDRAERLAQQAVTLDPHLAAAHRALAFVHFARRRSDLCRIEFEQSLEVATPNPATLASAGLMLTLDGQLERGGELMRRAVELNPLLPSWWHIVPCIESIMQNEGERALSEALRIGDGAAFVGPALALAIRGHLAHPGGDQLARRLLDMIPDFGVGAYSRLDRFVHIPEVRDYVLDGLRASALIAGLEVD